MPGMQARFCGSSLMTSLLPICVRCWRSSSGTSIQTNSRYGGVWGRTRNPGSSRRHVPSSSTALRSCRAARSSPSLACQGDGTRLLGNDTPLKAGMSKRTLNPKPCKEGIWESCDLQLQLPWWERPQHEDHSVPQEAMAGSVLVPDLSAKNMPHALSRAGHARLVMRQQLVEGGRCLSLGTFNLVSYMIGSKEVTLDQNRRVSPAHARAAHRR